MINLSLSPGRKKTAIMLMLVCALLIPKAVFAYMDPGIAGMLFQIGYIIFSGILVVIAFFLRPIRRFFSKKKEEKRTDDKE